MDDFTEIRAELMLPAIVGVIINGLMVLIIVNNKRLKTKANYYILSLAVSGILGILCSSLLEIQIFTTDNIPLWLQNSCGFTELIKDLCSGIIIFMLCARSLEYCCNIQIATFEYKYKRKGRHIYINHFLLWFALVLSIPNIYISDMENFTYQWVEYQYCVNCGYIDYFDKSLKKFLVITKSLIYYLLPLNIILFCFATVIIKKIVKNQGKTIKILQEHTRSHDNTIDAVTLGALSLTYFICWLPHNVHILWYELNELTDEDYNDFWNGVYVASFFFSVYHYCFYPIVLYIVNPHFRRYFNGYLLLPIKILKKDSTTAEESIIESSDEESVNKDHIHNF